eukprot:PITA_35754
MHGRLFLDRKENQWWVRDGSTKLGRQLTGVWKSTRQDLLPEAFHRLRGSIMRRPLHLSQDSYFPGLGFSKSEADPNLYQIVVEGKLLIIVLYVDDLILTGDELLILSCKKDLATEFEMKDLGLLHYFLGLEIWQRSGGLFVSQGKYAREILEKFNMHGCKPVDTPLSGGWRKEDATSGEEVDATVYRQLVGSLMYLVNTRTDICYAVNQLSQAMVKPTKLFWKAGKHVLRYLRGTSGYGLWYRQEDEVKLCGFTDADWAGSPTDRKSTSGGVFSIGSTAVSW